MDRVGGDIRHAARRLAHSPAFTLASVLTLALAIGANASIFAVVQRVVLNPLPYPDADRLIELDHGSLTLKVPAGFGITLGLYHLYTDHARTLDGIALFRRDELTITGDGEPERIRVTRVTPSLAPVLRVSPAIGRWFREDESAPNAAPAVVLSHRLWTRRYHAARDVVGRPVLLGGVPTEVVGVMPASFAFPNTQVDAWVVDGITRASGFGSWNYDAVVRLRDGSSVDAAHAELKSLLAELPRFYATDRRAIANAETQLVVHATPLKEATIGGIARALWTLLAAVAVVLLVACANVANLFLVRFESRQRDVAIRRALGADRFAIARYFLTESLLLSMAGGAVGAALAWMAVRLLVVAGPPTLPRLQEVRLDGVGLTFTLGVSLACALACGAIPLWRGVSLSASLQESGRSVTASRGRHRVRHLLMGAQVALALVLLVSSGLMVRSFQKLRGVDPGFAVASALTYRIGLPDRDYPNLDAVVAGHHAILDRLAALPGVIRASAVSCLPLEGGCSGNTVRVFGRTYPEGTIPPLALFRAVAGSYFDTMGIRVLRGRAIDRGDVERREPVVVISETFAQRFFPDRDPIGERVSSNRPGSAVWLTIVGVASDTPIRRLGATDTLPMLYMPMSVASGPGVPREALLGPDVSVMSYVVRTSASPLALLPSVRQSVAAVDPRLALAEVETLEDIIDRASAQMAFTMFLLAIAAAIALVLGIVGIYGVMSYIVSLRTGEIGVRLAFGAAPAAVARMIVRQGGLVALAGIGAGLAAALAAGRLIESLLYGVSSRDPVVFAATAVILLMVSLAACWLPARRAARLSPVEALRAHI